MSLSSPLQSSNSGNQWLPASHIQLSSAAADASLMLSLIFFVVVITIYINARYRRRSESNSIIAIVRSRSPPNLPPSTASGGLDAAAIEKLPTFAYGRPESGGGAAECVVCLGAVEEEETVRVLPECRHLFHVECIDMWLYSHSTCPVCRGEVTVSPERVGGGGCAGEGCEGRSDSERRRWVVMVDAEEDLERQ